MTPESPTPQPWQPFEIPPDLSKNGIYVGTSGYYFDDWIGVFNPPRPTRRQLAAMTDQEKANQDRLRFYQHYFPFLEINNTFYTEPDLAHFVDLESRSSERAMFAVKVHQSISHARENDAAAGRELMRRHVTAVSPLIETGKFYSFLIQLDDRVYRSQEKLDYLLSTAREAVSRRIDVHIEFRHQSWHTTAVLQELKNNGVGICNTDIPPLPHAFPLRYYATTDKGYVRYSGRNIENWYPTTDRSRDSYRDRIASRNARYDYEYSETELQEFLTGQIVLLKKTALMAVAYNNHYKAKAIRNAIRNLKLLKERLGREERGERNEA